MNKSLLVLFAIIISIPALEASEFCTRTQNDLKILLEQKSSRIAFKNNGGFFNQGVCWWHNRLQRSSAYLVNYEPSSPRPSTPEAWKILTDLRLMNKVVTIPGYVDFETFSLDYQNEMQSMLNGWQKRDGLYNFEWIRGISGKSSLPVGEMLLRMKDVYDHYKNSPTPLWIMAQIRGISSHSLMILNMKEVENGYDMEVIDSNYPQDMIPITYRQGDTSLYGHKKKYTFVPYVGFQNDFLKLSAALKTKCGEKNLGLVWKTVRPGEIER